MFIASGGYITCSLDVCPNPTALADMLEHQIDPDCVSKIPKQADRIERMEGALEYIWKWDRISAAAAPTQLPTQAEIARRTLHAEEEEL